MHPPGAGEKGKTGRQREPGSSSRDIKQREIRTLLQKTWLLRECPKGGGVWSTDEVSYPLGAARPRLHSTIFPVNFDQRRFARG